MQVQQHGTREFKTNVCEFVHFPSVTSKHLSQIKHLTFFSHAEHLVAFEPGPGLTWISPLKIILKVAAEFE